MESNNSTKYHCNDSVSAETPLNSKTSRNEHKVYVNNETSVKKRENYVCSKKVRLFYAFCLWCARLTVIVWLIIITITVFSEDRLDKRQSSVIKSPGLLKKENGFCLNCAELKHVYYLGGSIEITKYFAIDNEKKTCCMKSFQDFWTFVKAVAERKVNIELIKGNLCRQSVSSVSANCTKKHGNPAAHLVRGGPSYLLLRDSEGQELREWFDDRDKGFRTGIGYQDGRLVILETGNYYVYSQVFFVQTFARTNDLASLYGLESSDPYAGGSNRVWHAIYRFNEDYPNNHEDSLLRSAETKCWSKKKDYDLRTSYIGAVLSLRAGDQVMVRVSNVSLVSSDTESTYFGMYKI